MSYQDLLKIYEETSKKVAEKNKPNYYLTHPKFDSDKLLEEFEKEMENQEAEVEENKKSKKEIKRKMKEYDNELFKASILESVKQKEQIVEKPKKIPKSPKSPKSPKKEKRPYKKREAKVAPVSQEENERYDKELLKKTPYMTLSAENEEDDDDFEDELIENEEDKGFIDDNEIDPIPPPIQEEDEDKDDHVINSAPLSLKGLIDASRISNSLTYIRYNYYFFRFCVLSRC